MSRIPVAVALALSLAAPAQAAGFDLQGHRGARGLAPENTLAGFRRALEIGVTTIETDVGVTRDRVLVLAHDRRLNPAIARDAGGRFVSGAQPLVSALTRAELASYDVGRVDPASAYGRQWPDQQAVEGERIPTLADLFALVRASDRAVRLNLETKLSPLAPQDTVEPADFARLLVDAILTAGFADRTTIQSFDWRTLRETKRIAPEIPTSCLTTEGGNDDTVKADSTGTSPWHAGLSHGGSLPRLVKAARCDVWSPFWRNATRERIAEAHSLHLAVVPWTVNEARDMAALIDAGVDGLISDYPDRLRDVLRAKGRALP